MYEWESLILLSKWAKPIVFEWYESVHYSHPHRCMAQGYHIAPLGQSCSGKAHILLEVVANLHSTLRVYTIAIHIGAQVLKCSSSSSSSSCSSASSACALSLVPWALCLSALAPRARACVCIIRLERWIFQYPPAHGSIVPFLGSRAWAHGPRVTGHGSKRGSGHDSRLPRALSMGRVLQTFQHLGPQPSTITFPL